MFNFFKRKPQKEVSVPERKELSQTEKKALQQQILVKENEVDLLLKSECQETTILAQAYEELGVLQASLDVEAAIITLERSFSYKLSIGEGYRTLMSLYNQKRGEAAYAGDGDGINQWMEKIDELRQIARNNTISG